MHCLNQLQEYNQITQILCVVFKHYNVLCNTGGRKMKTCSKNEDDEVCLGYTFQRLQHLYIQDQVLQELLELEHHVKIL